MQLPVTEGKGRGVGLDVEAGWEVDVGWVAGGAWDVEGAGSFGRVLDSDGAWDWGLDEASGFDESSAFDIGVDIF
jgi:hypothetical protein